MEKSENPADLLNSVCDEETLLTFVEALIGDREEQVREQPDGPPAHYQGQGSRGWYNHTIEGFLEAAAAWGRSTQMGKTQTMENDSPWKRFAVFLYCGKIYE